MHNPARKIFRAGTGAIAAAIAAGILTVSAAAYAACTSPAAAAGAIEWFSATTQYKLCDGTNWNVIELDTANLGACTTSAAREYDTSSNVYKVCNATPDVTSGLVGHWKLDEGSGTTASNSASTGSSYNAAFTGSPSWITGRISNGMDFNNGGGWHNLYVPQYNTYDSTLHPQHLTIAFWTRLASLYGGGSFITKSCGGASSCNQWVYWIYDNGNGTINFQKSISSTLQTVTSTNQFSTTGVWHHVAATYDGSAMRLYVDGTLDASLTGLADDGPGSNSDLTIGAKYPGGGYGIDGDMDDVRIYNRALSGTEISTLYAYTGAGFYKKINCAGACSSYGACGTAGQMNYSPGTGMLWCDGTNWRLMKAP